MAKINVNTHCTMILVKKGHIEAAVELSLMNNAEKHSDGVYGVFLDNAKGQFINAGGTARQFAGGLASLTAKGTYKPENNSDFQGDYGYYIEPKE